MQAAYLHDADEVPRFLRLLCSLFVMGKAHLCAAKGDGRQTPVGFTQWGWKWEPHGPDGIPMEKPQGVCLGWLDNDTLYLNPDATYAAVQDLGRIQGENIALTPRSLWGRLAERGLLTRDHSRQRNTVRRKIGGVEQTVLCMREKHLGDDVPAEPVHSVH
jgi:hypothetical protein